MKLSLQQWNLTVGSDKLLNVWDNALSSNMVLSFMLTHFLSLSLLFSLSLSLSLSSLNCCIHSNPIIIFICIIII